MRTATQMLTSPWIGLIKNKFKRIKSLSLYFNINNSTSFYLITYLSLKLTKKRNQLFKRRDLRIKKIFLNNYLDTHLLKYAAHIHTHTHTHTNSNELLFFKKRRYQMMRNNNNQTSLRAFILSFSSKLR
jgi:hypothetical protein